MSESRVTMNQDTKDNWADQSDSTSIRRDDEYDPSAYSRDDVSVDERKNRGGDDVDPDMLKIAQIFYDRYKSACHGISRRSELETLFKDTFPTWNSRNDPQPDFSKVLYALARGVKVVKVVDHGRTLLWRVFKGQKPGFHNDERDVRRDDRLRDDRRDDRARYDERPKRRDDRRDDRSRDDQPRRKDERPRDDRRLGYDVRDYRRDDRSRDDRPRYDERPRDDRRDDRSRYDDRRDDRARYDDRRDDRRDDRARYDDRRDDRINDTVTLQKQIEAQAKTIDMLLSRLDLDGTSSRGM